MIRKLKSGRFGLYSRTKNAKKGRRRNLGTLHLQDVLGRRKARARAVQYFKRGR